ncbi:protein PET100 homolog, mitochondrial [Cimex lectularius]|uniref:Protein PET100 homolog, mitochondrial n=1 Tax=Cimex lectularius TaxID=79782 RepID=A0A8I6SDP6_CIMLE|nr:protein PET100 homolog, mitochondrial [Cimex lectularius]
MGGWKLEVGKMALYMAFPVGIFHFFNQPQYFEDWVVSVKREIYPPENPIHREMLENAKESLRKKEELNLKKQLDGM